MIAGSRELIEEIRPFAVDTGGVMAPFVAWLILRGLKTLALRVDRHSDAALEIARFLEAHPKVERVHYPGLASHPDHARAARTLGGRFGGVLAFDVGSREVGKGLIRRIGLIKRAASIGDVHSLIIQPAETSHRQLSAEELRAAQITEGFVRISVGLEEPADLIRDLDQALSGS
jgi:methionine-gamma-lyase